MDREFHVCASNRRSAQRPVPPSNRPFAELFRGSPAGHADEPHHGDVECRLHDRKHVRLERAAAMCRHIGGDRLCHDREHVDGGGVDGRRRPGRLWHVQAGRGRTAAAPRIRQQGCCGRRRDDRCHQQHAVGQGILQPGARAAPPRFDDRSRARGTSGKFALSREAAHPARPDHRGVDDRSLGLGHRALAARRNHNRRRGPCMHARTFRPACDAGLGGGAGRCGPALRPLVRSLGDIAGSAWIARSSRGGAPDAIWSQR